MQCFATENCEEALTESHSTATMAATTAATEHLQRRAQSFRHRLRFLNACNEPLAAHSMRFNHIDALSARLTAATQSLSPRLSASTQFLHAIGKLHQPSQRTSLEQTPPGTNIYFDTLKLLQMCIEKDD